MMNNTERKYTLLEKIKLQFQATKEEFKDPTLNKIRTKKLFTFTGVFVRTFILVGLCFVILLPILQKFSFALRHPMDITNPQVVWIPEEISTINIQIAAQLLNYSVTLINTSILSVISMFIQIIATAIAGYSFARLKFKGNSLIFYIVIFTLVVPNETLHVSRVQFLTNTPFFGINLIGSVFSMYILAAFGQGIRSAIFIYLFRQFFKNVPVELEESAQVDGAGVIRTFWSVMLPNARGAIVTVGLFAFVWQWNDYYFANLLKFGNSFPLLSTALGGGTERLDTVMSTWVASGRYEFFNSITDNSVAKDPLFFGLIANTGALLMMLPLLIGYFFVQKLFVESIERTGITG